MTDEQFIILILTVAVSIFASEYFKNKGENAAITEALAKMKSISEQVSQSFKELTNKELQEKRVLVIEEFYGKIKNLSNAIAVYTNNESTNANIKNEVLNTYTHYRTAFDELAAYWQTKDIYFPQKVNDTMSTLIANYHNTAYYTQEPKIILNMDKVADNEELKFSKQNATIAGNYIAVDMQQILDDLKTDFQKIVRI